MAQVYFSVFEARRNYKVHRLIRDFEVLLCPDWIRFAQSVWATSRQNLSSELKLKSAISVSEASHLGYNKFRWYMYSIWAANNTDNAYTVHQAPLIFVVRIRHNKKERRKKERKKKSCLTTKKLYGQDMTLTFFRDVTFTKLFSKCQFLKKCEKWFGTYYPILNILFNIDKSLNRCLYYLISTRKDMTQVAYLLPLL